MLAGQLLGEHPDDARLGGHLVLRDGQIAGNGIDHATLELHERVVVVTDRLDLATGEGVLQALLVTIEHLESGRVDLCHDGLAGKVGQRVDAAVRLHDDDLTIDHVHVGEGVVVLATLVGEAVPDAGDVALVDERVLGIPVNRLSVSL